MCKVMQMLRTGRGGSDCRFSIFNFRLGRRWDSTAQLYYSRMRDYSPQLGRFLQPDPAGYIDRMNLYAYVGNNPLNWLDPWGLLQTEKYMSRRDKAVRTAARVVNAMIPPEKYTTGIQNICRGVSYLTSGAAAVIGSGGTVIPLIGASAVSGGIISVGAGSAQVIIAGVNPAKLSAANRIPASYAEAVGLAVGRIAGTPDAGQKIGTIVNSAVGMGQAVYGLSQAQTGLEIVEGSISAVSALQSAGEAVADIAETKNSSR
ncbi:MAG TPA: RHS repeat-associated core domain-containing protein [Anaerohalosphaeraceae bacterium]|nr:RHS repeat-associated core domain-containing protein [Anaerohalosphaeraceae bacterium]HPP56669.1 RHS repeat-associated core domain-containing protein [Anaerohalosphaeraceae bacterium]